MRYVYIWQDDYDGKRCEYEKRDGGYANKVTATCAQPAKYEVEGELLCEKHAGRKLIAYYLHETKDLGIEEI